MLAVEIYYIKVVSHHRYTANMYKLLLWLLCYCHFVSSINFFVYIASPIVFLLYNIQSCMWSQTLNSTFFVFFFIYLLRLYVKVYLLCKSVSNRYMRLIRCFQFDIDLEFSPCSRFEFHVFCIHVTIYAHIIKKMLLY